MSERGTHQLAIIISKPLRSTCFSRYSITVFVFLAAKPTNDFVRVFAGQVLQLMSGNFLREVIEVHPYWIVFFIFGCGHFFIFKVGTGRGTINTSAWLCMAVARTAASHVIVRF